MNFDDPFSVQPASQNSYGKETKKPGRVSFDIREIDGLIKDQGIVVRITPSIFCPNRTSIEGTNHTLDCPVCNGDEVVDLVDDCIEDFAVIQGIHLDRLFQVQGRWDVKDAQVTTRAKIRLYYWYKIEVIDFGSPFNQLIKRSSGDFDKLRYKAASVCDHPYFLIDSKGVRYEKGTHYRTEAQSDQLQWLTPTRPDVDSNYSFSYPVLPTFRVLETLHDNRYYLDSDKKKNKTPVNLPQQAVIRWDFMADKSGARELVE